MKTRARGRIFRRVAFGVACSLLFSLSPGSVQRGTAFPALAVADKIAIAAIIASALGTAAGAVATLPTDKPALHIDEFSLAVADDFNVGDHGTINLIFSVSYGNLKTKYFSADHLGHLKVQFFADDKKIGEYEETVQPDGGSAVGSKAVKATIIGTHPGSVDVKAKLTVSGWEEHFFGDDKVTLPTAETATRTLNVKEPYTVWIDGPQPPEIVHGALTTARLMVKVRTEDYEPGASNPSGMVYGATELDGSHAITGPLPGASSAGASYDKVLVAESKAHRGCPYLPPHPSLVNLPFEPNDYYLRCSFSAEPYSYDQDGSLAAVFARDVPVGPPPCTADQQWNPGNCACESKRVSLHFQTGCQDCASSLPAPQVALTVDTDQGRQTATTPFDVANFTAGDSLFVSAPAAVSYGDGRLKFSRWHFDPEEEDSSLNPIVIGIPVESTVTAIYQLDQPRG